MDPEITGTRRDRIPDTKGGSKKWPLIVIALIVIIGIGAFFFMRRNTTDTADANTTPTSTEPTSEPEPTEAEVDVSAYNIKVLNGTKVEGEAGKLKTALEEAGYKVPDVGNADKTTYTKSIIQAKSDVDTAFLDKLKTELEKTYPVGTNEELDKDDENDVVIIIGMEPKEEDEEATPEATTAPDATDTPAPSPTGQ